MFLIIFFLLIFLCKLEYFPFLFYFCRTPFCQLWVDLYILTNSLTLWRFGQVPFYLNLSLMLYMEMYSPVHASCFHCLGFFLFMTITRKHYLKEETGMVGRSWFAFPQNERRFLTLFLCEQAPQMGTINLIGALFLIYSSLSTFEKCGTLLTTFSLLQSIL